jgi:hypothetical protein
MRCNACCRIRNRGESRPPIGCTYVSDESCALSVRYSVPLLQFPAEAVGDAMQHMRFVRITAEACAAPHRVASRRIRR